MPLIGIFKSSSQRRLDRTLEDIIALQHRHNLATDERLIREAFRFALEVHSGQKRKDGRDYIVHPLDVAITCAEYWMDDVSVAAALLHDTVEDARGIELSRKNIEELFGPEVASIVEGVTKLKRAGQDPLKRQIETLKKLLAATAGEDIRTIIIKIFDRHSNVKSLDVFKNFDGGKEKQTRIEYETLMFYVPIAARLGLFKVAREMEDSLMKAMNRETYNTISKWVTQKQSRVTRQVNDVVRKIKLELSKHKIDCIQKFYHKGIFQIYDQIQQELGSENLDNIIAYNLTLLPPSEDDCYRTLGVIHRLFPHLRDSVYDFINNPKINGYQSLHTIILVPGLPKLQVLIRTREMDTRNHLGLIADLRSNERKEKEELVAWIDNLVSSFDVIGPKDFLNITSKVLFQEIEVVTPKGEPLLLPVGSTALDFAFHIHSEVALHAKHAEIDGKTRKLNTVLKRGQSVRIITDKEVQAQPHWFNWASNSTSRLALKKHFKKEERRNIELEAEKLALFSKEKVGIKLDPQSIRFEELYQKMGYLSRMEFLEELHTGRLPYEFVIPYLLDDSKLRECRKLCKLLEEKAIIPSEEAQGLKKLDEEELRAYLKEKIETSFARKPFASDYVSVPRFKHAIPLHFARCCHPRPQIPILALTSKNKGAVIHRSDCGSVAFLSEYGASNLVEARWRKQPSKKRISITIEGSDRPDLLYDLSHVFHDIKINILEIDIKVQEENILSGELIFEAPEVLNKDILMDRFNAVKSIKIKALKVL